MILQRISLALVLGVALFGQGERGTFNGTVLDPSGAAVAGALVKVLNPATGVEITSAGLAAKGTAAQGANIPEISMPGLVAGSGGVGGNVSQSSGGNENLNLWVQLDDYSDTGDVYFQTDNTSEATQLQFGLQIKNQPGDNKMDGTIDGELTLSGDVDGTGIFDLATASDLEDDDLAPELICTHVTGTVTAAGDDLPIDFVLPLGLDSALQASCASL